MFKLSLGGDLLTLHREDGIWNKVKCPKDGTFCSSGCSMFNRLNSEKVVLECSGLRMNLTQGGNPKLAPKTPPSPQKYLLNSEGELEVSFMGKGYLMAKCMYNQERRCATWCSAFEIGDDGRRTYLNCCNRRINL